MKCGAVFVLLSLLSMGLSAPLNSCDSLLKPISISNEDMLGKWLYIGGSSNLPGSRSLGHFLTSLWINISATTESNTLSLIQTQKIYGQCSSFAYSVKAENSIMLIETPFYLKDVYLPTDCSNCAVVFEEIISGKDNFTSLMLFSKESGSVSPAVEEMFKRQAECLLMPTPIMTDPNQEICPDNIPPSEGLSAMNSLLEAKMAYRVARFLDTLFDMFVN